jgi:hypothetical protein
MAGNETRLAASTPRKAFFLPRPAAGPSVVIMADITILNPDRDDDCDDDDDKRGKRGKRGHRGHRGPTGPTGPAGPGSATGSGLLKFSGTADANSESTIVSYLADSGVGVGTVPFITVAPAYPVAIARSLVNFATNVLGTVIIPPSGSIVIELLKNGVPVPGFSISYGPLGPTSGIKTVAAGPVAFAIGDTFDVRVTTTDIAAGIDVSATVGVE